MPVYIIVGLTCFVGVVFQSTMGFGGAVILMNVMPLFFPYDKTVALVQGCMVALNLFFCIRYWKKIRWDVITPPLIPGILLGLIFTFISVSISVRIMTILMGLIFIFLSVYYILVVDKVHMVPSKMNGVVMGAFSGLTNAFFSIAGPPIVLYFVPSIDDKESYLATTQFFFLSSSSACIIARIISGVYEKSDLPMLFYLIAVTLASTYVGIKVLKKVDGKQFKKFVYGFVGLNGLFIMIKELIKL